MTINDIKALANLKIKAQKDLIALCEPLYKAIEPFAEKSITGNKKKITTAIQNISDCLYVSIEQEQYFGTKLKVGYYPKTRSIKTESGYPAYLKGQDFLIWLTVKDNTIHLDEIKAELTRTFDSYTKSNERTKNTARNIETIAKKVEKLKSELWNLQKDSDTELTEQYNIRF